LAWFTYRFVEIPVRFGVFGKARVALLAVLVGATGILGSIVYYRNGFQTKGADEFISYYSEMNETIPGSAMRKAYRHECNFLDVDQEVAGVHYVARSEISSNCYTRDSAKSKSIFLWGDSHAQQLYFGLSRQLSDDWQILQVATSNCGVLANHLDGTLAALADPTRRQVVDLEHVARGERAERLTGLLGMRPDTAADIAATLLDSLTHAATRRSSQSRMAHARNLHSPA